MVDSLKLEKNNIKEQLKYLAAMQGLTLQKLKEEINHKYQKTDGIRNLGNKLRNGTFRVSELLEIADILNYEVYLYKKK